MSELAEVLKADDGAQLWHTSSGAGPPLILCHGGPGLWDYLGPLAALIEDVAEVHRWDQRGGGRSSRTGPYTMARMVEDMEAVRRHDGVERWVVAGHSWGAELALHYAVAHPQRTRALVYISGRGLMDSWRDVNKAACRQRETHRTTPAQRDRLEILSRLPQRTPDLEREFRFLSWFTDFSPGVDAEALLREMLEAPFEINFEANEELGEDNRAYTEHLRAALPLLAVPALLIHGSNDPRPTEGAEELARLLPHATLDVVQAGHLPWLEIPATIRSLLAGFLGTLVLR